MFIHYSSFVGWRYVPISTQKCADCVISQLCYFKTLLCLNFSFLFSTINHSDLDMKQYDTERTLEIHI